MKLPLRQFIPIFGVLLLATCGDDIGSPTRPQPETPLFDVQPDTLHFTVPGDSLLGDMSVVKAVTIQYSGSDSLHWSATEDLEWLSLSADSGLYVGTPDSMEAIVWYDTIEDGQSVSGDVIVTAGTHVDTVHVIASNNQLRVICAPDSLMIFVADSGTTPYLWLPFRGCGNADLDWTAESDAPWAGVVPKRGNNKGEWDNLRVWIEWDNISRPGPHTAHITVHAPHNDITGEVQAWWPLCTDRPSVYLPENTNPGPTTLKVRDCGPEPSVDWTASVDKPWAMIAPTSGTSFGGWDTLEVAVDWSHDFTTVQSIEDRIANITFAGDGDTLVVPVTANPSCRIVFEEPNASNEWVAGSTQSISWRKISSSPFVYLTLYKGSVPVFYISYDMFGRVPNFGGIDWLVSTNGYPSGSDYRFRIVDEAYSYCEAWSDSFTITVP